jgi:hypothetical protein
MYEEKCEREEDSVGVPWRSNFRVDKGGAQMKLVNAETFFGEISRSMFYVGFVKTHGQWLPLCSVSSPQGGDKFDSLYVSLDYMEINDLVQSMASQVKGIDGTFVHYLRREEVENIMESYGLKHIVFTQDEDRAESGCGCGCGCQHGLSGPGGCAH